MRYFALCLGAAIVVSSSTMAHASVILFEKEVGGFGNEESIPQSHGDRISAEFQDGFHYGTDFGFTPNVVVDWNTGSGSVGGNAVFWPTSFGDLIGVIESEPEPNGLQFMLTADPGFLVQLHGFDMAGWSQADYTIDAVTVRDGNDAVLFQQTQAQILGAGPSHTSFDFDQPLTAEIIKIEWDSSNLGGSSDNIGMDNIAFSQIPEPASVVYLLAAAVLAKRRKKCREPGCPA